MMGSDSLKGEVLSPLSSKQEDRNGSMSHTVSGLKLLATLQMVPEDLT